MKLFLFVCILTSSLYTIDPKVYDALGKDSLAPIDVALTHLKNTKDSSQRRAYTGVLTMKKAGYIKGAMNKLNLFKEGKVLLEQEITAQPENTEYKFLRLIIQENAPSILNYKQEIEADKKYIIDNFKELNQALKTEILNYAKTSSVLNEAELK